MKRIAHITDIYLDETFSVDNEVKTRENWDLILKDVAGRKIDTIIFGGDIGAEKSYPWFFNSIRKYSFDLKITPRKLRYIFRNRQILSEPFPGRDRSYL